MILRSPVSVPPSPLAGPFRIGDAVDYVEFDPTNAQYVLAAGARPIERMLLDSRDDSGWSVGTATAGVFSTDSDTSSKIRSADVTNANDGGWRTKGFIIERWHEVSEDADVIVPIQAAASAGGNVYLKVNWDLARDGAVGVLEGSVSNVVAGPATADEILYLVVGTIPGGKFQPGDCITMAIQRMAASESSDTYTQTVRIARYAWIAFKRKAW